MTDTEKLQLKAVEKWLLRAEDLLASFQHCYMEDALEHVNEACSKVEDARDEIHKMLPGDSA